MATAFRVIGLSLLELAGIASPECDHLMEAMPRDWLVGFRNVRRDRSALYERVHDAVVASILDANSPSTHRLSADRGQRSSVDSR